MAFFNALTSEKPHAVCMPFPAQGHIKPMLKLAKLLHFKGFHITFVNTEFIHKRLLKSQGPNSLNGLPTFRFKMIPDGLPPADANVAAQHMPSLCQSIRKHCLQPFRGLLSKLKSSPNSPPVTCLVSDGIMNFSLDAAQELGIPGVIFWTTSACAFMGYIQYGPLIQKGLVPLKDASYLTNGYLDTVIDWIPGMRHIRLRDLPTFVRTTDPNDIMLKYLVSEYERAQKASAIIFNTFDALELEVLDALSTLLPPIYCIGPLQLQVSQIPSDYNNLKSIESNLWREETECLEWLDSKEPNSVVYVNFGSITVMTSEQLIEFVWGLANSNKAFLWVIRPDLVLGESAAVPPEFLEETKERGLFASWCPQEQVLSHPAVGGFLTHSGWNSSLESLCGGVPMICWPFFAEQQTNCRFCCKEWGVGIEIEGDVKRNYIEDLVRTLMEGEKGKEMRKKAMEWKKLAEEAATGPNGLSFLALDNIINRVLLSPRNLN
ncbi:PREDICTED: 7-deoxyloganetin [Prunus dulcis]|uniref:Glycosyltransferase n=1 Tax=Prunus dulcis TaxID=3755 RepID=A0A5E4FTR0_PRUDU|nr:PREDICTED: 7-deoxyloganetin [Prunus dulcis]